MITFNSETKMWEVRFFEDFATVSHEELAKKVLKLWQDDLNERILEE